MYLGDLVDRDEGWIYSILTGRRVKALLKTGRTGEAGGSPMEAKISDSLAERGGKEYNFLSSLNAA